MPVATTGIFVLVFLITFHIQIMALCSIIQNFYLASSNAKVEIRGK